tara:strand:+ start:62 stop:439 length:378 start_codon:yes stop_codon:yes gene_type:complete
MSILLKQVRNLRHCVIDGYYYKISSPYLNNIYDSVNIFSGNTNLNNFNKDYNLYSSDWDCNDLSEIQTATWWCAKNSELWKKNKSNIYLISKNEGFYNLYQLLKKEDINVYWNSKLPWEVISTQN